MGDVTVYRGRTLAWRKQVLARDEHLCQMSSPRCEGELQVHHVVLLSRDRSRRFDPDNGVTLCRWHHEWCHLNPERARTEFQFVGHSRDKVVGGRVVLHNPADVFFREEAPPEPPKPKPKSSPGPSLPDLQSTRRPRPLRR